MWPWELETVFGHGLQHTITVMRWYVQNFPLHLAAVTGGVLLLLCAVTAVAGIVAKKFITEPDPSSHLFGGFRSARKKGFVK